MGKRELHFKVSAESVVKLARDMVIEKNWRRALPTLTSSTVPPLSLEAAISILKGEQTLVMEGEQMVLGPQDPACPHLQRMLSTARWQHAGMYETPEGEFYQPYALIEGFNWEDRRPVIQRMKDQEDWCTTETHRTERARHYMDDARNDLVFFLPGPTVVLMKRVQGPPFWMQFFTDPAEAWADFKSVRRPEIKGADPKAHDTQQPDSLEFYYQALDGGFLSGTDSYLNDADQDLLDTVMGMLDDAHTAYEEDVAWSYYWKTLVCRQADKQGGYIELEAKDDDDNPTTYKVARYPFLMWAQQYDFRPGELPEWDRVCPSGMKMSNDNPLHTDWWVSSGLPFRTAYNHEHPLNRAAWRYAYRLAGYSSSQFLKLAGTGKVTGPIAFPKPNEGVPPGSIAVVSHAGPAFELALMSACKGDRGAVIAEVGGKLAHLAIVSRELGARLAVREGALTMFKEGDIVTLDFDKCELRAHGKDEKTNEMYSD